MINTLRYYIRIIRWLVRHRHERNCRQKYRRMERELQEVRPMPKK
jgi:hypothetical protein